MNRLLAAILFLGVAAAPVAAGATRAPVPVVYLSPGDPLPDCGVMVVIKALDTEIDRGFCLH